MLLKGLLFGLLILFGGLIVMVSLILTIQKHKNKRVRNIWLALFLVSLATTGWITMYTVKKVIKTSVHLSKELNEAVAEGAMQGIAETMTDNRDYLLDTLKKNNQIELLRSYVPDSLKNNVPNSFYTCFGFRDWYRFPLVYPYSINCVDIRDFGYIADERDVIDIINDDGKQLDIYGITDFAFDKNLLLAKLKSPEDNTDKGYIIFNFITQETEEFDSDAEFLQRANELGYAGPDTLVTIREYDKLF